MKTGPGKKRKVLAFIAACLLLAPAYASALPNKYELNLDTSCEQQATDLKAREEALKVSEQRLNALKKEIDQKITRYANLLAQVQDALNLLKAASNQGMQRFIKVYDTMPPANAAQALSRLDQETAIKIMLMMNPRKAAAVMAEMSPEKASAISNGIFAIGKKLPGR